MLAQLPPMGWNTWNTFGDQISEALVLEMAGVLASQGYRDAGYRYLVIDDCWSLKQRNDRGELVPDPEKFPHGMRYVADRVHSLGLKLGIYSCAGVLTCAGYPGSYDHEFQDARTFASWGIDYLKYDFCNFPASADGRNRYLTMGMALRSSGREILFAACNWGTNQSWNWMRSVGAHMYRSTGDIFDNYRSFTGIFRSQVEHLSQSGPGCFNDLDVLTVGMYNRGNAAIGALCTAAEYRLQFALWALAGSPLFLGADLRTLDPGMKAMVLNRELIALDQDGECRPLYPVSCREALVPVAGAERETAEKPLCEVPEQLYTFVRLLSGGAFALAFCNFHETEQDMACSFADLGLPWSSGLTVRMRELFTGEEIEGAGDWFSLRVPGHDCRLYRCTLEEAAHG